MFVWRAREDEEVWGQAEVTDCVSLLPGPKDEVISVPLLEPGAGRFVYDCRAMGVVANEEEKYVEGRTIDSGDLNV